MDNKVGSGYIYEHQWYSFVENNRDNGSPLDISTAHHSLFNTLKHQNNLCNWSVNFNAPTTHLMNMSGIKSYNTYKKVFNDLVAWGFVKVNSYAKNAHTAKLVTLSIFDTVNDTQNNQIDQLPYQHLTVQVHSKSDSSDDNKNSLNYKPINNKTTNKSADAPADDPNEFFDLDNESLEKEKSSAKRENQVGRDCAQLRSALEQGWDGFLKMRKKSRKYPTDYAIKLIGDQLEQLAPGNESLKAKILDQSTRNGWTDVYPLRNQRISAGEQDKKPESKTESALRRHNEFLNEFENEHQFK